MQLATTITRWLDRRQTRLLLFWLVSSFHRGKRCRRQHQPRQISMGLATTLMLLLVVGRYSITLRGYSVSQHWQQGVEGFRDDPGRFNLGSIVKMMFTLQIYRYFRGGFGNHFVLKFKSLIDLDKFSLELDHLSPGLFGKYLILVLNIFATLNIEYDFLFEIL